MLHSNRLFALALIFGAAWLCACRTSQAQLAPARRSSSVSSSAKLAGAPSSAAAQPHSFSKQPPHEGALSVYNNPGYGLTLRYPRNYLLDEELDLGKARCSAA